MKTILQIADQYLDKKPEEVDCETLSGMKQKFIEEINNLFNNQLEQMKTEHPDIFYSPNNDGKALYNSYIECVDIKPMWEHYLDSKKFF